MGTRACRDLRAIGIGTCSIDACSLLCHVAVDERPAHETAWLDIETSTEDCLIACDDTVADMSPRWHDRSAATCVRATASRCRDSMAILQKQSIDHRLSVCLTIVGLAEHDRVIAIDNHSTDHGDWREARGTTDDITRSEAFIPATLDDHSVGNGKGIALRIIRITQTVCGIDKPALALGIACDAHRHRLS